MSKSREKRISKQVESAIDRLRYLQEGTTHWEGCESEHVDCAAIMEIERLTAENNKLKCIVNNFLELREWCIDAGGSDGPLPQDVIDKFAEMQLPIVEAMKVAVSSIQEPHED